MTHKLHLGDCLEVMHNFIEGCIDAVVTDPPYGINFQSNGAKEKRYDVICGDESFDLLPYYTEMERIVKDRGAIYIYTRWDIAYKWQEIINPTSQIIIPRGKVGMGDLNSFSCEYEVVLFKAMSGHIINATSLGIKNNSHAKNPPKYKVRIGNLWNDVISNEAWERAEHPTQKTINSFSKMIQVSTNPGDTIFDPFMGSGTTGVAAIQLGRNFVGCEIDPDYFAIAEKRIKEATLQPNLFESQLGNTETQKELL